MTRSDLLILRRYQCCPLYQVKWDRSVDAGMPGNLSSFTQKLPPVAWIPSGPNYAMPIQDQTTAWPFFAVDVFAEMGVPPPIDEDLSYENIDDAMVDGSNTSQPSFDDNLASLIAFGFDDDEKNKEILCRFNNDLQQTVNHFLDNENVADGVVNEEIFGPSTSVTTTDSSTAGTPMPTIIEEQTAEQPIVIINLIDDSDCSDDENPSVGMAAPVNVETEMEDCTICCIDYESYKTSPSSWELLQCNHKLCVACHAELLTTRCTMSGQQHTFIKCPFCQGTTGIEIGTCPDMRMAVSMQANSCESYEGLTTITISYTGRNFNRTAYLPNNAEGQEVLKLLEIAFDRRLCFTVGTSATTGMHNTIVWNIHHKTSLNGGVSKYGYPDPGYMERVKWELKGVGIE